MKLTILLVCCLVAAVSAQDNMITCSTSSILQDGNANLTCHFPEDLSVTKRDFSVYHYSKGAHPDAVIDCMWKSGRLTCFENPGYKYNMKVDTQLTVTISRVTSSNTGSYACQIAGYRTSSFRTCQLEIDYYSQEAVIDCMWKNENLKCLENPGYTYSKKVDTQLTVTINLEMSSQTGTYVCQIAGYRPSSFGTCHLEIRDDEQKNTDKNTGKHNEEKTTALTTGLAVGLLIGLLIATVIGVVMVLRRRRNRRRYRMKPQTKMDPLLASTDAEIQVETMTNQRQSNLIEIYPNMLDSFYFVPPIYFNKTGYKQLFVDSHVVYVSQPSDPRVVKHDQAMQHFLHCLHRLANQRKEQMFVLTQFNYDDYLNNPGGDHDLSLLPMPSGLEGDDENISCFDILVINKTHGVLVGVVKALSDEEIQNQNGNKYIDERDVAQIEEALKQLKKADCMIRHLMSDQQRFPKVNHTIILPNLSRASLQCAITHQSNLVQKLRECLGATAIEDPTGLCLCSDDLSDPNSPWNVSPAVVTNICQRWKWTTECTDGDIIMTNDLYLETIARFFGPATQSTLIVQDHCERFVLPKTLAEAVFQTGDLYGRLVFSQKILELLNKPVVALAGPQSDGTDVLAGLAVERWLISGYDVFIVKDTFSSSDLFHWQRLKEPSRKLYVKECNFKSEKSINECVKKIVEENGNGTLYVMAIVCQPNGSLSIFCNALRKEVPGVHLWIITDNVSQSLGGCDIFWAEIPECPPAVLREVGEVKKCTTKCVSVSVCPSPTDGPPVKYICHTFSWRTAPVDCLKCGQDVGSFLAKTLLIGRKNISPRHHPLLRCSDVLIVLESNTAINKDNKFLKGLRESGITVDIVKKDAVPTNDVNSAKAINIRNMKANLKKTKVLVYVESYSKGMEKNKIKQKVLTKCTSQLILVQPETHNRPFVSNF